MRNRWQNRHAKLWVFHEMTKWRWWRLMLHGWWQQQLPRSCTVVFWRDDMLLMSKHCRRWPDNPNGQSKFNKHRAYLSILRLFMSTRSWLMLCGFQRSFKQHLADIKNITGDDQIALRIDQNSAITKIYALKDMFLLLGCYHYDAKAHCFISYYHSQQLFFSPMKNNFSMTLTPTEKPRYAYWRVFL